jgi:leucyl-tRNA synthetase
MEIFDHKTIDKKWQEAWEKAQLYKTPEPPKPKQYILDMFPYPSGAGLHVGHPEGYTATDILSRYKRMQGFDVLHPMGWDAFGLPAENYAIKEGVHPAEITKKNIERFREQIKAIGLSYDWSREINTSDPSYYKWTQWLFLQLYKKGLAYKKEAYVNWCPKDQTVLANEQVIDGKCDRCGTQVVQKLLSQWFFKITDYADRLLNDLETLDWPEPIKLMQKNWIGKSEGAQIKFKISNFKFEIEVFTTRPDTLYGATYMVLAPEHLLVDQITTQEQKKVVEKYIEATKKKTELQRTALEKDKTGVFTGAYAVNPATKEKIPVWIADYVLATYGTGAIMAVPAHDERDFEFAKKYDLPMKQVIKPPKIINAITDASPSPDGIFGVLPADLESDCWTGDGTLINSDGYDGMESEKIRKKMAEAFGVIKVQYKLRDWLISRQRYWGAPIPIIYCDKCGMQPVPEKDLPVELPDDVDFRPTGESPLARSKKFNQVKCPKCDGPATRDHDTMDTFVDSSWYFFRFTDPHNDKEPVDRKKVHAWMPVDVYVGGAEHAVLHLLYARFFTKACHDLGFIDFEEPFLKLRNQGLILGPDGEKMSKSRGNVINPDDVIAQFGADAFRMYEMFMGPLEEAKPWQTNGIVGVRRFLDKVGRFAPHSGLDPRSSPKIHKLIKKITADIENFKFNTAVAAFMEFLNENKQMSKENWESFLILLAPFAPHITEELWHQLGHEDSIHLQKWPKFDENLTKEDTATIVVQVLGRVRASLELPAGTLQAEVKAKALADANVKKHLHGKEIVKEIFVQDKLINFVVK